MYQNLIIGDFNNNIYLFSKMNGLFYFVIDNFITTIPNIIWICDLTNNYRYLIQSNEIWYNLSMIEMTNKNKTLFNFVSFDDHIAFSLQYNKLVSNNDINFVSMPNMLWNLHNFIKIIYFEQNILSCSQIISNQSYTMHVIYGNLHIQILYDFCYKYSMINKDIFDINYSEYLNFVKNSLHFLKCNEILFNDYYFISYYHDYERSINMYWIIQLFTKLNIKLTYNSNIFIFDSNRQYNTTYNAIIIDNILLIFKIKNFKNQIKIKFKKSFKNILELENELEISL